ncbi:MAG: hypothetical protein RKE50_11250 [Pseudohaliea sp.]
MRKLANTVMDLLRERHGGNGFSRAMSDPVAEPLIEAFYSEALLRLRERGLILDG